MRIRLFLPTAILSVFAATSMAPSLRGQQTAADPQHDQHHPEATAPQAQTATQTMQGMQANAMGMMNRMKATDSKLDELVKKMNAASGQAKVDAMAALLTALVEDRHVALEPMMSHMMSMMNMMGGGMMNGRGAQTPPK